MPYLRVLKNPLKNS